jgi:hypothetical protein
MSTDTDTSDKAVVIAYIDSVKKILALESWTVDIGWKSSGDAHGFMAIYDHENKKLLLNISEKLLETEDGVNKLFSGIVTKLLGIVTGEAIGVIQKFESQMQKVILHAMKVAMRQQT